MIETLSKFLHEECWMMYADRLIKTAEPIEEIKNRWQRDCMMPYDDLSEVEKEKDRQFARKLLELLEDKFKKGKG